MDQVLIGVLAVVGGIAIGALVFVPAVAISHRRSGGLSAGRIALWIAAFLYFWVLWAYALLPLPAVDSVVCAGTNLTPFAFVDDVRAAIDTGRATAQPAMLQVVFNVALFVPLGFFLRVLGGRGILVAGLVGLGASLLIEATQVTGLLGVYPCGYRVFDVDDLLLNTSGALFGSLLAFIVPARHRGFVERGEAGPPRRVTRWRRFLAMASDYVGAGLFASVLAVGTQAVLMQLGEDALVEAGLVAAFIGAGGTALLWLVVTLVSGQTIGDLAAHLEYRGGPMPLRLGHALRWIGGVGGYVLLTAVPWEFISLITLFYLLLAFILLFTTKSGRGLPGLLSERKLFDDREPVDTR